MFFTARPNETVPLVYVLDDASDATTYYPQAIVKNSTSGATVATVNLTAAGSGRYEGSFQAPQDPYNAGTWLDLVITLYDDSGHTTANASYRRQTERYLIQERWSTRFMGGGGGSDLTKKDVREVVKEELDKALPEQEKKEEAFDMTLLVSLINSGLAKELKKLPKPSDPLPVNFQPVIDLVNDLKSEIKNKIQHRVDTLKETYKELDLSPIQELVDEIKSIGLSPRLLALEKKLDVFTDLVSELQNKSFPMVLKMNNEPFRPKEDNKSHRTLTMKMLSNV